MYEYQRADPDSAKMRTITRRLPFIICVAAVVLVQRNGHPLPFGISALAAFGNLFSSQFLCTLDGCRLDTNSGSWRDPAHIAPLIFRITSITGFIILAHALADMW